MNKFKNITHAFTAPDYQQWAVKLYQNAGRNYKERFLAKVGTKSFFIETDKTAYFSADNKIVFLHDADGNRFVINYTMEKLESLLDPHLFFRINRKFIIHSRMIDQIKPFYNNRLKLTLKNVKTEEDLLVSRERVQLFRAWADG